jgi:hypothetical protein
MIFIKIEWDEFLWENVQEKNEKDKQKKQITVFCLRPSARCCAPLSSIWLSLRLSMVSVCVKKIEKMYEKHGEKEGYLIVY